MRLLCDEMLRRLGRWLRAAGYDTAIAEGGLADRELLALAAAEQRILLTRDRHLAAFARPPARVVLVEGHSLDEIAPGLRDDLKIDWLRAPFTRCLVDNTPLRAAEPQHAAMVPPTSLAAGGPLRTCPACGRLYWPGGHVRRMERRLAAWCSGE